MADYNSAQIEYYDGLKELEKLLSRIQRPGDFSVNGVVEVPMPKVEIKGVGVLSFPVPEEQIKRIVQHAERAPYGRGEETVLDESVRKVWQLPPSAVHITGKSWGQSFQTIMSHVARGLGCKESEVSAELYKLLVYDKGGFFLAHRDTEKADGMFGTLVVVLPSFHQGGELLIRHAGHEIRVDMSTGDVSELCYAAFYADCEHEVKPIREGNRVCLVYNLIQKHRTKKPLTAPEYDAEVNVAAEMLKEALSWDDAPLKVAYLLEHQYSPAGLSFEGLKNADLARAQVLSAAALRAGCEVHLGIVHIEESGPAELSYDSYGYGWRRGYDEDEEEEEKGDEDFEVVEVSNGDQYIDQWVNLQGRPVGFGAIPVEDGELFPAGALDDVAPDESRAFEATGNEGASFERSYHRAAVVIWRRERYSEVLLQAGVGAAIPYLREKVQACKADPTSKELRTEAIELAELLIEHWKVSPSYVFYLQEREESKEPDRATMLHLLVELGEVPLVERFIETVISKQYDGRENVALVEAVQLLGPSRSGEMLSQLATAKMAKCHGSIVELLIRLVESGNPAGTWQPALQQMAAAVVSTLGDVKQPRKSSSDYSDWEPEEETEPVDSTLLTRLFESLSMLKAEKLRSEAAAVISSRPKIFDPRDVILPALADFEKQQGRKLDRDPALLSLCQHVAEFLLARSEYPPEEPTSWRQKVSISCSCEDCQEMKAFLADPVATTHRFRVRQDRREHLEELIRKRNLDISHVTERKGTPHTLVCTKTRWSYERRCEQYRRDIAAFQRLLSLISERRSRTADDLIAGIQSALQRSEV